MRDTNRRLALALLVMGSALAAPVFAAPDAIGFGGALPLRNEVRLDSAQQYDFTFDAAPVDWRVQSGEWQRKSGWTLLPTDTTLWRGWPEYTTWFNGYSNEIAAIWNRHRFSGDFSVRVSFEFKGGTGKPETAWSERPSDFAISFCGDGTNLGSGYTLVIGADGNSHTVLRKQGAVVAETTAPEALFTAPTEADVFLQTRRRVISPATKLRMSGAPPGQEFYDGYAQRYWSCARIDKVGRRIQCWLGDKLLFTYSDPQPLDVGQFALWTYNNDIVLLRMKVYYENEVKKAFLPRRVAPVVPTPIDILR